MLNEALSEELNSYYGINILSIVPIRVFVLGKATHHGIVSVKDVDFIVCASIKLALACVRGVHATALNKDVQCFLYYSEDYSYDPEERAAAPDPRRESTFTFVYKADRRAK